MAKKITAEEVKEKIDNEEDFYLIDTLASESYAVHHIPGAQSVPYEPDFLKNFSADVGASKDAEIITYCASSGCQLSALAADALEEAGYTNVGHFADGLAGWKNAGYAFEGSGKSE